MLSIIKQIYYGIKNFFTVLPIDIQELVEKRQEICGDCPAKKRGRCTECGCVIALKTRSLNSECPLNKWEPVIYEEGGEEVIELIELPVHLMTDVTKWLGETRDVIRYQEWQEYLQYRQSLL